MEEIKIKIVDTSRIAKRIVSILAEEKVLVGMLDEVLELTKKYVHSSTIIRDRIYEDLNVTKHDNFQ